MQHQSDSSGCFMLVWNNFSTLCFVHFSSPQRRRRCHGPTQYHPIDFRTPRVLFEFDSTFSLSWDDKLDAQLKVIVPHHCSAKVIVCAL
jgi:hypothetical protein